MLFLALLSTGFIWFLLKFKLLGFFDISHSLSSHKMLLVSMKCIFEDLYQQKFQKRKGGRDVILLKCQGDFDILLPGCKKVLVIGEESRMLDILV